MRCDVFHEFRELSNTRVSCRDQRNRRTIDYWQDLPYRDKNSRVRVAVHCYDVGLTDAMRSKLC